VIPPRRRGRRALIILGVVVAVPAGALAGLQLVLRDSVLRPRVIAAVQQATGRAVTLSGPVGIKLSLVPTITLQGLSLANAEGGSAPEMLTAERVEARLALLPLLSRHIAFDSLTLIAPDLLLERDAAGQGNWRFQPQPSSAAAPPAPAPDSGGIAMPQEPVALFFKRIEVRGGSLTWRDAAAGTTERLEIRDLLLRSDTPEAPLQFAGNLSLRGQPVALEGGTAAWPLLLSGTAERPLHVTLGAPGIHAVLDGALAADGGWRLSANATADRAARLAAFLPGVALPPLTGLDLQAQLAAAPGAPPRLDRLTASSAGGDLSSLVPGLVLGATRLSLPAADQPTGLSAALTLRGLPLQAEAVLPPLAALMAPPPWPLRATLRGQGLELRAEGNLSAPRPGLPPDAAELQIETSAADTAPLLSAFAVPGPRLTQASLSLRLLLPPANAPLVVGLSGLRLRSTEAVLEGEATLKRDGPRPAATARLAVARLDIDRLMAAPPPPAAAAGTGPAAAVPAPPPRPALPQTGQPAGPIRTIPAVPLPVEVLRRFDAELQLTVAELVAGGGTYRDSRTTARLAEGRLRMEPLSVGLPGGRLELKLGVDAAAEPPRFTLAGRQEGPGLDLRPLLQAYGLNGQAGGRLELEADLNGSGTDLRSLAGSLGGQLGLAMVNGQIDNRLLDRFTGDLRRMLVPSAPSDGGTALRCLALRLALREGVARPQALLLETGLADVVGSGEIDLRQERLALRLLPQLRLGSLGLTAPVLIGGSFRRPTYRLDPAGAPEAAAGIIADLLARQGETSGLEQLAQQLAGRPAGSLPDCAQQLAVARGGRSGPVPPEQRASPTLRTNPADLLRGLFGR
jgi:uncharacterized protein involved in outer membrane biogenesis